MQIPGCQCSSHGPRSPTVILCFTLVRCPWLPSESSDDSGGVQVLRLSGDCTLQLPTTSDAELSGPSDANAGVLTLVPDDRQADSVLDEPPKWDRALFISQAELEEGKARVSRPDFA